LPLILRRTIRRDAHGHGMARLSPDRYARQIREDLDSLAIVLGDQPYFFGERPHQLDAIAWAFLGGALATPVDGPLRAAVRAQPTLVAQVGRFGAAVMGA
jgi:glutathione S-transferase